MPLTGDKAAKCDRNDIAHEGELLSADQRLAAYLNGPARTRPAT